MTFSIQNAGVFLLDLISKGWIIDTRAGGLVIGKSHSQGNIYMFRFSNNASNFKISFDGNVEGGEYIVNYRAYCTNAKRFQEINTFYDESIDVENIKITKNSRIFHTHANPSDKLLLIDNAPIFTINKYATAKYYEEIEYLNSLNNSYLTCDIHKLIPKDAFNNNTHGQADDALPISV